MTKIALLGRGKTGSKVLEVNGREKITVFHRENPPTYEKLKDHDVILSFLPGDAFSEMIPLLVETKKPVVTGSTGLSWPVGLHEDLKKRGITWIYASNFALGMTLMKEMILLMGRANQLFEDLDILGPEVHDLTNTNPKIGKALVRLGDILKKKITS